MITTTGKLTNSVFEFVGSNGTPKLTVDVTAGNKVIPATFIGDRALNALALLGDGTNGNVAPGTLVRVLSEPTFRHWEGDAERGPKTFTTELAGLDLMILGTVGAEDASFMFQGVLHSYNERHGEGQNGPYTIRTMQLALPVHKKDAVIPQAWLEMRMTDQSILEAQKANGQFVLVAGKVSSRVWTPKSGKNAGVPQRSFDYTIEQVMPLSMPAWIAGHAAFAIPEQAGTAPVPAPAPAPAATFDTPLF